MSARPRPPRLAVWLARLATPPRDRGQILGDLEERFSQRCRTRGVEAARRWYGGQALMLALVLIPVRVFRAVPGMVAPGTTRSAFRAVVRSPRESVVAVITLSVGIAGPSAMFALASGTTRSLPGDPHDRVVSVSLVDHSGRSHSIVPWPLFELWRANAVGSGHPFAYLGAYQSPAGGHVAVGGGEGYATRYRGVYATSDVFHMLGVRAVIGRLYDDSEDNDLPAVLIREDVWRERFDEDPAAVGRILVVDGVEHVVVGVLPDSFGFPGEHRIWMQPSDAGGALWSVAGRLDSAGTTHVGRDRLGALLADTPWGQGQNALAVSVERYIDAFWAGQDDAARKVGMVLVILVLIAAANVATLMLARGVSRSQETAVRMALGATRSQVMALTLTEAGFLALGGGLLGLGLGRAILRGMLAYLTSQANMHPYWMDFEMGGRSLVIAGALSTLSLALAGGIPALRSGRVGLGPALRMQPVGGSVGLGRLMALLVVGGVTLSCFLLGISSVMVDGVHQRLDTGATFPVEGLRTAQFVLKAPEYPDAAARRTFLDRLTTALLSEPAVRNVSLTSALPGKVALNDRVAISGIDGDLTAAPPADVRMVDATFFDMLDLHASTGRLLSADDRAGTPAVAVVNAAFVRERGLADGPVGRQLTIARAADGTPHVATIVGVVDDHGATPGSRGRASPGVYLPVHQLPPRGTYLMARMKAGASLLGIWHETAAPLDPYVPLGDVMPLSEALRRGHGAATLYLFVFLALGGAAFLVALVGLHGVHSFVLARRMGDIGVRRALGAGSGRVLRDSLSRGLRPVWIGVVLGSVPGFVVARALMALQEPHPLTYVVAPALLLVTSVVTLWGPTTRAAKADPMAALREG